MRFQSKSFDITIDTDAYYQAKEHAERMFDRNLCQARQRLSDKLSDKESRLASQRSNRDRGTTSNGGSSGAFTWLITHCAKIAARWADWGLAWLKNYTT